MIRVRRGDEPPALAAERNVRLPAMRTLARSGRPKSEDFVGYGVAKSTLGALMAQKCWYCERRVEGKYEPVEHYRPKSQARRGPGYTLDGYWWLAWTWENLMFICDDCNKAKGTAFPLDVKSVALVAEEVPPGQERALLLDPSAADVDPVDHIEFFDAGNGRWLARARRGSPLGAATVRELGLDGIKRPGVGQLFGDHVNRVMRDAMRELNDATRGDDHRRVVEAWDRVCRKFLRATNVFAALSYDALDALMPPNRRARWGLLRPRPPWEPATSPVVR